MQQRAVAVMRNQRPAFSDLAATTVASAAAARGSGNGNERGGTDREIPATREKKTNEWRTRCAVGRTGQLGGGQQMHKPVSEERGRGFGRALWPAREKRENDTSAKGKQFRF